MLLEDRGHDPWRRRNGLRVLRTRMTGFKVVATDDRSGLGGGEGGDLDSQFGSIPKYFAIEVTQIQQRGWNLVGVKLKEQEAGILDPSLSS